MLGYQSHDVKDLRRQDNEADTPGLLKGEEFGFYKRQLVTDDLLQTSVFLS